jgi:site-specific recombinase XerD
MNIPKYTTEFKNELQRKGYRDNSIKNYVSCVESFLHHFDQVVTEPIKVNESQIKEYLRGFTEHNTQRAIHSAIKTFYKYVCRQPEKFRFIEYCKRTRRLPIVFSVEEIQKLFNACSNLKHRSIVALMYSTGLRVGEVINLKIENIDSSRMVINILNAKGGKDRQVMLNQNLLDLLRNYFKEYRPKEYLFNGQNSLQYSERSIAQFLKHYAENAGLNKRIYPHLIRHCSFTHLVESGTDINLIQRLAGHQNVKTTNLYIQTSHTLISRIQSPLSQIRL